MTTIDPSADTAADMAAPLRYLDAYLAPLLPLLERADVTDILINRPFELWVETLGGTQERHAAPELDAERLWWLARQVAALAHQGISREHPLLAAALPDGSRIQVIAPPATRGHMAIAIRKHVVTDLTLSDYAQAGALAAIEWAPPRRDSGPTPADRAEPHRFLANAVRTRRNILVSGGTGSGKTTFLNVLMKEIPPHERLVVIEDTPELQILHRNAVGLVAVKGALGEARVTTDDLLQASLRMRPDRIVLGELRGGEAYSFLRGVNSGHPGSFTTIHADSPRGAVEQMALIVLQGGTRLSYREVVRYVLSVVDVFVHLERLDGRRVIRSIATRDTLEDADARPEAAFPG